jgi:hypothetical protein
MLDPLKFLFALALLIALGPRMAAIVAGTAVVVALALAVSDRGEEEERP